MAINPALYSSRSEEWPTPRDFFDTLNAEFTFTLDPCATPVNATCPIYFTKEEDGLLQDWGSHTVFCNPPYGRSMKRWAEKCLASARDGATVVLLAHSRTDTRWFHDFVLGNAELRFVRGRLHFGDSPVPAPFPSMIAVFRPSLICPWRADCVAARM